jgi:hypothetical protein
MRGSDVTKTHQQCAALALLALGELERDLCFMFVADVLAEKGKACFESFLETPETLAGVLATEFLAWIEKKLRTLTDQALRLCLLCLQLTRKYKLSRLSVRDGDSIMVECLHECFIPIWLMTSKHNYVEIALNQIEDLCGRTPYHLLQTIRENRMQPLHPGADRDGTPMAQWTMDALMELLQIKHKAMNFPNSREDWQNHSTNMPLVPRARMFCNTEHSRRCGVEACDKMFFEFKSAGKTQDNGDAKTQTKIPKSHKERTMVAEALQLADAFTETPGRKMTLDAF